jgi:outer membrane protein assembly factor BamB
MLAAAARLPAAEMLCVSDEGIHCFAQGRSLPIWQRLLGRTTYDPVAVGELLIAGGSDGVVAFVDGGARRWELTDYGHAFTPTVAGSELFFGTLNGAVIAAGTDGSVRWQRRFSGWMYSPAVIGDAVVSGGQAGVLHAVHRATGNSLWNLSLDQELVHHPVAFDGTHFVTTTFAGTLLKLDARTGRVAWRRAFGVPSKSPVVAGRLLLCALFDGRVAGVAGSNGEVRWEAVLPAAVQIAASADLVVAFNDERLTVLRARDGQILQRHEPGSPIVAVRWLDERRIAIFLRDLRNQVRVETVHL